MRDPVKKRRVAAVASLCLFSGALAGAACKSSGSSTGAGGAGNAGTTTETVTVGTSATASGSTTASTASATTATGGGTCVFGQSQFGACAFGP